MAFSDLQVKVMSDAALFELHSKMAKLQDFAKSYNELEGRPGQAIVVPVYNLSAAAEFDASSNNYGSGVNEIDSATLTLEKHFVKSIAITDRQLLETGVNWYRDGGKAVGDTIGRAINSYVFSLVNATNCPLTSTFAGASKSAFTDLYKVAYDNDLDVGETVVALNPEMYSKLLSFLDSNVYGGNDAIKEARVPGLYGFASVICTQNLPDGAKGALIDRSSIGIASRYLSPMDGAYPTAFKAVDPDSGLTIGFREFQDLASGGRFLAAECLLGAKVLRGNGVVRLVAGA